MDLQEKVDKNQQEEIDARRNIVNALQSAAHWATATFEDKECLCDPYISVLLNAVQKQPADRPITIRSTFDDFVVLAVFTGQDLTAVNRISEDDNATEWLEKLEITLNSSNVSFTDTSGKKRLLQLKSTTQGTIDFTLTVDFRLDQATGYAQFVEDHTEFVS